MKKLTALIIVLAIVLSTMAGLIVVSNAYGGTSCLDFIILQDADHKEVGRINSTKRNFGDISAVIAADNVKYIRFQGWHSEDVEIVDMGYSVDEGDVVWGYSYYDANLVANKAATQHEYPLRFGAEVPVEEGEDILIELWYKLEDGEEDSFGTAFQFTYTNVPSNDSFISFNLSMVKYIDGEFAPNNGVITVSDPTNQGKDWIGLFYLGDYDVEDLVLSEADYLGYKSYITGDKIILNAENFKQEGAQDLEFGEYALVLLENDTYKILSAVPVTIGPEMGDTSHYDNVSIIGLESDVEIRDFGDITEEITEEHNMLRIYGWYTSDYALEGIGYRFEDGTEEIVQGVARTDASNATGSVYGMGIDLKIPVVAGVDVSFDLFVKYADGDEEVFDTFYYTYNPNGEFTPKPTKEPTPTPEVTPTPEATATPEVTEVPETEAPSVTDVPANTDAPAKTEAPSEPTAEPEGKKGGCGSALMGGAAIAFIGVAVLALKKKH